LYRVSNWYRLSGTNDGVHLYRARYPVQMFFKCYQPVQMFPPVSPLFPSFFSFLFSSHLISSRFKITNFTSLESRFNYKIHNKFPNHNMYTHHITYYINLIHLVKFSQQHNNQDSMDDYQFNIFVMLKVLIFDVTDVEFRCCRRCFYMLQK
jgi:hypothetical protein